MKVLKKKEQELALLIIDKLQAVCMAELSVDAFSEVAELLPLLIGVIGGRKALKASMAESIKQVEEIIAKRHPEWAEDEDFAALLSEAKEIVGNG